MPLTAQGLSPLLEGKGDHFAAGIPLEADLGAGDKHVLVDGSDFERPLVGSLHEQVGARCEHAQGQMSAHTARAAAGLIRP